MQKIAALSLLCCSLYQVQSSQYHKGCSSDLPLPLCDRSNKQPCFTSCSNPKFDKCPDVFIAIYDPKVCGYTNDGRWLNFNSQCQACQNPDVTAVVGEICNCEFTGCPSGQTCENGQCVDEIIKPDCRLILCPAGQQCIDGQGCIPVHETDPCGGKCKDYQFCDINGECVDNCARIRCQNGYTCKKGNCVLNTKPPVKDRSCIGILCIIGSQCVNGKCIPIKTPNDNNQNGKGKKIKCTYPRPNQQNCPVINYLVAPQPVACGVDKFGNRQDYSQICSACKDTKNIFYYESPCDQVPGKKQCLRNQKLNGDECGRM